MTVNNWWDSQYPTRIPPYQLELDLPIPGRGEAPRNQPDPLTETTTMQFEKAASKFQERIFRVAQCRIGEAYADKIDRIKKAIADLKEAIRDVEKCHGVGPTEEEQRLEIAQAVSEINPFIALERLAKGQCQNCGVQLYRDKDADKFVSKDFYGSIVDQLHCLIDDQNAEIMRQRDIIKSQEAQAKDQDQRIEARDAIIKGYRREGLTTERMDELLTANNETLEKYRVQKRRADGLQDVILQTARIAALLGMEITRIKKGDEIADKELQEIYQEEEQINA